MNDLEYLSNNTCPDCKQPITNYFASRDIPWCKNCDVYFTPLGYNTVVRNKDAMKTYNQLLEEKLEI